LKEALDRYAHTLAEEPGLDVLPPWEPYRRFIGFIQHRLRHTGFGDAHRDAYTDAAAFAADLGLVRNSLADHGSERLARFLLDPLLRQVETFGFHLHTLDIRQHAKVHAAPWPNWQQERH